MVHVHKQQTSLQITTTPITTTTTMRVCCLLAADDDAASLEYSTYTQNARIIGTIYITVAMRCPSKPSHACLGISSTTTFPPTHPPSLTHSLAQPTSRQASDGSHDVAHCTPRRRGSSAVEREKQTQAGSREQLHEPASCGRFQNGLGGRKETTTKQTMRRGL